MRAAPTPAEALAWSILRARGVHGLKFRRQQPLRGFIADFYCHALGLVLELDGGVHGDGNVRAADEARDELFASLGLRVLRLRNEDLTRTHLESLLLPFLLPLACKGEGAGG